VSQRRLFEDKQNRFYQLLRRE